MTKIAIVALGGNALAREGERGTQEEQYKNAIAMAHSVRSLIRQGWRVIVVHGNGPQVGSLAIQHEEGAKLVPAQPLFVLKIPVARLRQPGRHVSALRDTGNLRGMFFRVVVSQK